jgi:hypothetical protein
MSAPTRATPRKEMTTVDIGRATFLAWVLGALIVAGPTAVLLVYAFGGSMGPAGAWASRIARWSLATLAFVAIGPVVTRHLEDLVLLSTASLIWFVIMIAAGLVRARRLGVPFGAPAPDQNEPAKDIESAGPPQSSRHEPRA